MNRPKFKYLECPRCEAAFRVPADAEKVPQHRWRNPKCGFKPELCEPDLTTEKEGAKSS